MASVKIFCNISQHKYPVSKRTVQYIQQLSNTQVNSIACSLEEESDGENSFFKSGFNDIESLSAIESDNKISFYMDEVTGKYLVAYVNLIRCQIQSKNNLFPLFEAFGV